jgi:hypothetical protein
MKIVAYGIASVVFIAFTWIGLGFTVKIVYNLFMLGWSVL